MRIVSIHVEGFGVLRERTHTVPGPLALFYGANEAGKSTLMGFIRAVLFGFPNRANPAERYEPLRGGAHGGSLTLLDEQGQRIVVERYDSSSAGQRRSSAGIVKVTLGDGTTGGEELLNSLLGGLSADLFRSLFAFGLGELQELRTLQSEEISGYLYSAGLGVSGSTIMEAERKLAARTDALFKPRGRNQEINRLQKELEELERTLRRSKERIADYDRLLEEKRLLDQSIEELELQKQEQRLALNKLEQAGKARSIWLRLKQIEQELEELPVWEQFPEHAVARLEAIEADAESIEEQKSRVILRQNSLRAKLDSIKLDESVWEHAADVERLLEGVSVYQEQYRALLEMKVEVEQLEQQLGHRLRQIDERWDRTTLAACPVSIELRERIREQRELFHVQAEAEQRLRTEQAGVQQQLLRQQEAYQDQQLELQRSSKALSDLGYAAEWVGWNGQTYLKALQRIVHDYSHYKDLHKELEHQQERLEDNYKHRLLLVEAEERARKEAARKLQLQLWSFAGLGVLLLGWLLIQQDWIAAVVILICILGLMGYSLYSKPSKTGSKQSDRKSRRLSTPILPSSSFSDHLDEEDKLQPLIDQITNLEQQLMGQVAPLLAGPEAAAALEAGSGKSALSSMNHESNRGFRMSSVRFAQSPSMEDWNVTKKWLDNELEHGQQDIELWKTQLAEQQRREDKLNDMKQALHHLEQHNVRLLAQQERIHTDRVNLERHWSGWLASLGFSGLLTPDAALESLQLVEQGQELLRQLKKLEARITLLHSERSGFEQEVAQYLDAAALKDPVLSLTCWKEQYRLQLRLREELERGQDDWSEGEQERLLLEERLVRCLERKRALLAEGYATTVEQLRHHQSKQERRLALIEEGGHLDGSLAAQVGRAAISELALLLENIGEAELSLSMAELEQHIHELEEKVNQQREHNGRLLSEIEKLESGTDHANQLLKLEGHKAALQQLVDQYAVVSFASLLFKKSREIYEKERQPGVLLRASDYFSKLTDGRYTHIRAPFGEQRLVAMKVNGEAVDTSFLSRGTAEQLYLAMRFALIEEYARKQSLPLILDDILVNFDQKRMENCLELLVQLSQRHQILLFTCHQHVRDVVMKRLPQFQLIEL
jgi:uncharacterized protein YhaN